MGSELGYSEEKPVHRVLLPSFAMDAYPVTNGQYKVYCDATETAYPANPRWDELSGYFLGFPDYPVVNVSWESASKYAKWVGKRLPTEEEWEYAARGGLEQRNFPWGDSKPDSKLAHCSESVEKRCPATVGSFPPNGLGLFDMAGNVWEWCQDWFFDYNDTPRDLAPLEDGWGSSRVCRGGCFYSVAQDLRVSRRRQVLGGIAQINVGFRCVRDTVEDIELCMGVGLLTVERALEIKSLGFTSVEQYVTWETIENSGEGQWDFSVWDQQIKILRGVGLKWVPFLIAGPAYSLPDWYRARSDFIGLRCLEHGLDSKIQSLWDGRFHSWVDRFLAKVAEHFGNDPVIEALILGISGDFGESIFPVWHGNWPTQIAGHYHSHAGYWCGDPVAQASYGIPFPALDLDPMEGFRADEFTLAGHPRLETLDLRVKWMGFVDWYRNSMTDYAEFWMKSARGHFSELPIYLCTGGDASACHGSEFAAQAKMAARYNGGIRITNEASHFATNFSVTNWVASAGEFYGTYFSFEPAGRITKQGILSRIYNASTAGAKGLHFYEANLLDDEQKSTIFRSNLVHLRRDPSIKEIGVLFPDVSLVLGKITNSDFLKGFELFRDFSDFRFLDDLTIQDGILGQIKVAVICCGEVQREDTLDRLRAWVEAGGILVAYNIQKLCAFETDGDLLDTLFDRSGKPRIVGKGQTYFLPVLVRLAPNLKEPIIGTHPTVIPLLDDLSSLQANLFDPLKEYLLRLGCSIPDGILDGVFACRTATATIWLDETIRRIQEEQQ